MVQECQFCSMETDLDIAWHEVLKKLEQQFGGDLEVEGILFLIGIQELGQGFRKFNKDEKLDVIHIAVCTLLEPYGYYEFKGEDKDKWPHWERNKKLPPLKDKEQQQLMKQAIVDYFRKQ